MSLAIFFLRTSCSRSLSRSELSEWVEGTVGDGGYRCVGVPGVVGVETGTMG